MYRARPQRKTAAALVFVTILREINVQGGMGTPIPYDVVWDLSGVRFCAASRSCHAEAAPKHLRAYFIALL